MIITKQKNPDDILKMLEGRSKIFLIGCGDCATTCKTGGQEELAAMSDFLKGRGKEVTGLFVPDVSCISAQAKIAMAKNKAALKTCDAVLVFACGSGLQCFKENDRYNLSYFPGSDTMFAALIDKEGKFKEVCRACGQCLLELTEGICPTTQCSKGLLNGPCGGQNKGKCEADKNRDCAWLLIYKRLKEKGKVDQMKKRLPPKDHSIFLKGR